MSNPTLNNLMRTDFFFMYKVICEFYMKNIIYCNTMCQLDGEIEQKSQPDHFLLRIKIYTKFKGL